jgi:hypothetical protein
MAPPFVHWKIGPVDPHEGHLSVGEILLRLRAAFPCVEEHPEAGRRRQQEKVDRLKVMNAPPMVVKHEEAAVASAVYVLVSDPRINERALDFVVCADHELDGFPEFGKHVLLKRVAEALDYELDET